MTICEIKAGLLIILLIKKLPTKLIQTNDFKSPVEFRNNVFHFLTFIYFRIYCLVGTY